MNTASRYLSNHPSAVKLTSFQLHNFSSKIEKGSHCWLWLGAKDIHGYGQCHINHIALKAHRVSYFIHKGAIPIGLIVRHSCDNPSCVNPAHLLIGTEQDNANDAIARNRLPTGANHHWQKHPELRCIGESNGKSKLTASDVIEIRARCIAYGDQTKLAKEFGVRQAIVGKIVNRKVWKHIP